MTIKGNKRNKTLLDLQHFADNTQTTLLDGLSPEMKTFYEKDLLEEAEPNLVHSQFGDKYPIPANGGKTIEFRKYDSLPKATTPLTEGVTPDGQSLNVSAITATVRQYGGYVVLSDMLRMTAIDNNIVQATKLLGSQAGRTLDTITRDVLCGGTNVIYAGGRTSRADLTAADVLTPELCFKAAAQLKAMNAPTIDGSYVGIIHPYAAFDLMRNEEWIDVNKYSNAEKIFNGEIGKIAGIRFVETSEAKIWNDSVEDDTPEGLAVFGTLILGAKAYGTTDLDGGGIQTIVKQLGYGNDPLNQRSSVGWKHMGYVTERLIEQYMIRIESCSAYSGTASANP